MSEIKNKKLIYGTAWKKESTSDLVETAIMAGFRAIDTACQPKHYEEALVGEGIKRACLKGIKREELYIQTKFTPFAGQDPNKIPYNPNDALDKQVFTSFDVSKKNLQTGYVDSLVLHSPLFPYSNLLTAWDAMEQIHMHKGALELGISNCYELNILEKLYNDAQVKPTILQNRFYRDSDYDKDLRLFCAKNGITYQSFWTLTANPHILASQTIYDLSRKYNKTAAQIFYRFISHNGIIPLIGTTSKEHMLQDLAIFEFELLDTEVEMIETLLK